MIMKSQLKSNSPSNAAACSVLCKDCLHFEAKTKDGVCLRPIAESRSLVTGEIHVEKSCTWCSYERKPVTRIQRFFGADQCGSEGRYFAQNVQEHPTEGADG